MHESSLLGWTMRSCRVYCCTPWLIVTPGFAAPGRSISAGRSNPSVRPNRHTELNLDAEPGGQVDKPREGAGGQGRQVAAERDLLQIGGRICCAPSGQNGEPNAIYER